ncbi:MAG: NAD(P)H-dependent glycerol-3-phosphate dehydrogenase [Usitatibacter sp.]
MKIAVLGAGAWGSALAISLCGQHEIRLWARNREDCEALERDRASRYLPDHRFPDAVRIEHALDRAVDGVEICLVATATSGLRASAEAIRGVAPRMSVVWACKGFEQPSLKLPHQVAEECLPQASHLGALSGPSFAQEVARGLPTALVLASRDARFAAHMSAALNSPRLRVYSSADVIGVELGGAVKNVIAIAAGISDGLGLGRNARAALVTRGLAEIVRLGEAMGGQAETFMGLAGVGDLVLTCTGDLSRNRDVGLALAKGMSLERVLSELGHVAEGVHSAQAVRRHAERLGVEMPITEAVCAVLFEGAAPLAAVQRLLARDPRAE